MKRTEDSVWVHRNYCLLRDYLFKKFPNSFDHREYMLSLFQDDVNSYSTRTILEDFQKTDEDKIKYFIDKFRSKSLICLLVAGRGMGKTAFSVYLLKELSKFKPIYALYPFNSSGVLDFVKVVFDISQVPCGAVLYIDELAKKYKSRDFSSKDALAMTDELIGLRHNNISVIGGAQDLALIDNNFIRLSDIQMWKYYNLQNEELTREGFISDLIKQLMPEKQNSLNHILVNDNGEISTFKHPLIDESKLISTYLKDLRTDKPLIIKYLQTYYSGSELFNILRTQYGIMLTTAEKKVLK